MMIFHLIDLSSLNSNLDLMYLTGKIDLLKHINISRLKIGTVR